MSPGWSRFRQAPLGFTLVELLVVVLIIGVLAAIALPRFLGQRTRSKNAAAQAAARHALVAARSYYTQNSETYAGLDAAALKGYESSLSGTEPSDSQQPGASGANPQDIWIGNGTNANNPVSGDSNNGKTVTLCSVSRGDTIYCIRDVDGVASYYSFTGGAVLAGADGNLYSASGWSAASGLTAPTPGTPAISGTTNVGSSLSGNAGSWSGTSGSTSWSWTWRRCNASGTSCADIAGASGTATGPSAPTISPYPLVSADSGNTIRLQVQAQNGGASCNLGTNCAVGTSTQTATITSNLAVDYLVVAGGGGGGSGRSSGGGGGGGVQSGSMTLAAQSYTVTVGGGGSPGGTAGPDGRGGDGANSSALGITSVGGGGGGGVASPGSIYETAAYGTAYGFGRAGGSGGGGASHYGAHAGGNGTAGQGNTGGNAPDISPNWGSGGGGGAGAVGGAGTSTTGGGGGGGTSSSITGSALYYGGGGGGGYNSSTAGGSAGSGGSGGGGAGSGTANATGGTVNTGGGGGGAGATGTNVNAGGSGGSGVVIIRYLTSSGITATGGTITTSGSYRIHTFTSSGTFSF